MKSNLSNECFFYFPAGVAILCDIVTSFFWVLVLIARCGKTFQFPAKCCYALNGFGGFVIFFGLPATGIIFGLISILTAKRCGKKIPLYLSAALTTGLILLAIAVTAR